MRTTVEIPDEMRAQLLEIAAKRRLKGFSTIVQEAIARYLEEARSRADAVEAAQAVLGTMTDEEANALHASTRELRSRWR